MTNHPASEGKSQAPSAAKRQESEGIDFITMEVDDPTYDRLVEIARTLNCTPAAALEEVIREFKP